MAPALSIGYLNAARCGEVQRPEAASPEVGEWGLPLTVLSTWVYVSSRLQACLEPCPLELPFTYGQHFLRSPSQWTGAGRPFVLPQTCEAGSTGGVVPGSPCPGEGRERGQPKERPMGEMGLRRRISL